MSDKKLKMQAVVSEFTGLIKKHGLNFVLPVLEKGVFYFRGNEAVGVLTSHALPNGKAQIREAKEKDCPYEFYIVLGRSHKKTIPRLPIILN